MIGTKSLRYIYVKRYRILSIMLLTYALALFVECVVLDTVWPVPHYTVRNAYPSSTMIRDRHDQLLRVTANHQGERYLPVKLQEIAPVVLQALIASEDKRFYQHSGVDYLSLVRACVQNICFMRRVSGASTITMQMSRLKEPRKRGYWSKYLECLRARQWERSYSKSEILEQYLNDAPFGGTLRGIEAASLYWYGKSAAQLTLLEAASLIAMLPAPSVRRPDKPNHKQYRDRILHGMCEMNFITHAALNEALLNKDIHAPHKWPFEAAHICDAVIKNPQDFYRDERFLYPRFQLSLDLKQQQRAQRLIDRMHQNESIDGVALVYLKHGKAIIHIGSRSYQQSMYDAAIHAHDVGSTLKPFIYAQALESGVIQRHSLIQDVPTRIAAFTPQNFDRYFQSQVRSDNALSQSRNIPAVRLLQHLGIERFQNQLSDLRIDIEGERLYVDAALGTLRISPVSLAHAYYEYFIAQRSQRDPAIYRMLSMRSPDQSYLAGKQLYWKTGTSSGRRNAWSIVFNNDSLLLVWMGKLQASSDANTYGSGRSTDIAAQLAAQFM